MYVSLRQCNIKQCKIVSVWDSFPYLHHIQSLNHFCLILGDLKSGYIWFISSASPAYQLLKYMGTQTSFHPGIFKYFPHIFYGVTELQTIL